MPPKIADLYDEEQERIIIIKQLIDQHESLLKVCYRHAQGLVETGQRSFILNWDEWAWSVTDCCYQSMLDRRMPIELFEKELQHVTWPYADS